MTLVRYIFSYIIHIILILVKNLNMEINMNPNDLEKYWIERQKINQSYVEKRQNLQKQLNELEVEHQTSINKLDDKFGKTIKSWINAKQNMMKFLDEYEKEKRNQFEIKNNEAKEIQTKIIKTITLKKKIDNLNNSSGDMLIEGQGDNIETVGNDANK